MAATLSHGADVPAAPRRTLVDRAFAALGYARATAPAPNGHARPAEIAPPAEPPTFARATGGNLDPTFWLNERLRLGQTPVTDPYTQHTWFYAIVAQRAKQLTQARFALYPRTGKTDAELPESDPLVQLFLNPCPGFSTRDLFELTQTYLDTVGEAFWILDREDTPTGVPRRMWPAPGGSAWRPKSLDATGAPESWLFRRQGREIHYGRHQVVLIRNPDPRNPLRGLAPGKVAMSAVETDVLLREYNADFFRNGAQPGGIVEIPGKLSLDDRERAETGWQDEHGGPGRSHRVAFLEGGVKWHPNTISQRDMEFLDLRRWSREELAAVFDWPLWMLTNEKATYAEATAARARLWFDIVIPLLRRIEGALDQQLFQPLNRNVAGLFDIERVPALMEYRQSLWATALQMVQAGSSLQEANRILDLGMKPQPGWDDVWRPIGMVPTSETLLSLKEPAPTSTAPNLPAPTTAPAVDAKQPQASDNIVASEGLNGAQVNAIVTVAKEVAAGVLPLSSALAITTVAFPISEAQAKKIFGDIEIGVLAPGGTAPDRMAEIEAAFARKIIAATTPKSSARHHVRAVKPAALRRYWRAWRVQVAIPSERGVSRTARIYLGELATAIERAAAKHLRGGIPQAWRDAVAIDAAPSHADRRWDLILDVGALGLGHRQITETALLDELFPLGTWDATLRARFRPLVGQIAQLSGAFTEASLSTFGKQFDPTSPTVASFLEDRVQNVVGINARARSALAETLHQGIGAGETLDELRARVASVSSALADPARALRIARTESGSIANGARFHMGTVGEDTQIWSSAADGIVRPSHVEAENASRREPVVVGQPFSNGLLYPQDPGGPPEESLNCRCSALLLPAGVAVEALV